MKAKRIAAYAAAGLFLAGGVYVHTSRTRASAELPGSRIPGIERAEYLGRLAGDFSMDITLSLKLRNQDDLVQFLDDVQDPASPVYHKFLTMAQFVQRYSPGVEDYASALQFLRDRGFRITDTWENRITIGATASAEKVERAFGVSMNRYRYEGREVFAAAGTPMIPAELAGFVDNVMGLDTIYRYHTNHIARKLESPDGAVAAIPMTNGNPPYLPHEFQQIYGLNVEPGVNDGAGQHVAVVLWKSNINTNDLQNFWNTAGIAQSLSNVKVVGVGKTPPAWSSGSGECQELALDVQYTSAFTAYSSLSTKGASIQTPLTTGPKVTAYIAKDAYFSDLLKAVQKFVSDGKKSTGPKIASLSYGAGEVVAAPYLTSADNAVFQNAAATGLTVCVSSGDDGSQNGALSGDNTPQGSWPSTNPYVLSIGGTKISVNKAKATPLLSWKSEVVWKNGSGLRPYGGSSGGGSSTLFTKPSWQSGKGVPSGNQRHTPDVSLDADPYTGYAVRFNGSWLSFGGTSASSPAIASFLAGVNQQRKAAGKSYLGQSNLALYDLFRTASSASYHDITSGNNIKYKATKGYDLCTGVGTIRGDALANSLVTK